MQNSRFVILTGHLRDYPLSDLVGILRHQRKSGRLTIEYPKNPGIFFFHQGELVDAQLNGLTGLQAICVALGQPEAAFNFNPLIQPSRRSIAPSLQRVVSELFGCWDESDLQIEGTSTVGNSEPPFPAAQCISNTPQAISTTDRRQLPPAPPIGIQRRSLLLVAAAAVLMMGLSTAITLFGRLNSGRPVSERTTSETKLGTSPKFAETEMQKPAAGPNEISKSARKLEQLPHQDNRVSTVRSQPKNQSDSSSEPSTQTASAGSNKPARRTDSDAPQSVNVTMQIENGRVLTASITDHKPGMESYEGLALRIAKQRRYPATVTGQESVRISVARPN